MAHLIYRSHCHKCVIHVRYILRLILGDFSIPSHSQCKAGVGSRKCLSDDICILCTISDELACKQGEREPWGRESCVVIIDQEDGNSTESLSL